MNRCEGFLHLAQGASVLCGTLFTSCAKILISPLKLFYEFVTPACVKKRVYNCHHQIGLKYKELIPLPKELERKIRTIFQREFNLNLDSIEFYENTKDDSYSFSETAYNRAQRRMISLPTYAVNAMQKEITDNHKFNIAHELGHSHYVEADVRNHRKLKALQFASFVISHLGVRTFLSYPLFSFVPYVSGCVIAKMVYQYGWSKLVIESERKAEIFAASLSNELAISQVTTLQDAQKTNQKYREECIAKSHEIIERSNCLSRIGFRIDLFFFKNFLIKANGDALYTRDFHYPSLSPRIKWIQDHIDRSAFTPSVPGPICIKVFP